MKLSSLVISTFLPLAFCGLATPGRAADPVSYTRFNLADRLVVEIPGSWTINYAHMDTRADILYKYTHSAVPRQQLPDAELFNADGPDSTAERVFINEKLTDAQAVLPETDAQIAAYDQSEHEKLTTIAKSLNGTVAYRTAAHREKVGAFPALVYDYDLNLPEDKSYVKEAVIQLPGREIHLQFSCLVAEIPNFAEIIPHVFDSFRQLQAGETASNPVLAHSPFVPIDAFLETDPIATQLRIADIPIYTSLKKELVEAGAKGATLDALKLEAWDGVDGEVLDYLGRVPAPLVIQFMRSRIKLWAAALAKDPTSAYSMLFEGDAGRVVFNTLPVALRNAQVADSIAVLKAGAGHDSTAVNEAKANASLAKVAMLLTAAESDAIDRAGKPGVSKGASAAAMLKFYRGVVALPENDAANVIRKMFGKQQ